MDLSLYFQRMFKGLQSCTPFILVLLGSVFIGFGLKSVWQLGNDHVYMKDQLEHLKEKREEKSMDSYEGEVAETEDKQTMQMLPEYQAIYTENNDFVGWLFVKNTVIDYPVMQTPDDESYYLNRGFDGMQNSNGCLIMDEASHVGVGVKETHYEGGKAPSTNMIIHGHNMKSGEMFGSLKLFRNEDYYRKHNIIYFDTLYEKREYQIIAVFFSQVYYKSQDVFKYYQFNQAHTAEEFEVFYDNIKALSLFDTGVTAEFGDEFITLSTCSSHVENGRLVVVGKRIN